MAIDIMGREIVDAGASADFQASLGAYSLTDRAPVDLPNMAAANQKVAALVNAGATQAFPFFCYVADVQRHMCLTAPGEKWITLGGRLHGAQVRVDRKVPVGSVTPLLVNKTGFLRNSPGFTRAPDGGVLIPESGLYRIHLDGKIDGFIGETGWRYVRFQLNGENLGGRRSFDDDTHFSASTEWRLTQGDVIMPVGYQAMRDSDGGTPTRVMSATLGIYQSLTPSW